MCTPFSRTTSIILFLAAFMLTSACDSSDSEEFRAEADTTATVEATANIFAAGLSSVPNLEQGRGSLPVEIDVFGRDTAVVFTTVEGDVTSSVNAYDPHGPDGGFPDGVRIVPCEESTCDIEGISGIIHEETSLFLTGVFLSDDDPASPPPPSRNVTDANGEEEFSDLQIGQVFFIGDGRSTSGALQRFGIPSGATRLYIGFPDTRSAAASGSPSHYGDNSGSVRVVYRFGSRD